MAVLAPHVLQEPFRLPHGSVRGGIATLVTATRGYLLLQATTVPTVLGNAVAVVVAFYFGSRATATPGPPPPGQSPPHRPRFVRALLLLRFPALRAGSSG